MTKSITETLSENTAKMRAEGSKDVTPIPHPQGDVEKVIERVLQDVADLPDRTSPDDWPEAMLVTGEELSAILQEALTTYAEDNERQRAELKAYAANAPRLSDHKKLMNDVERLTRDLTTAQAEIERLRHSHEAMTLALARSEERLTTAQAEIEKLRGERDEAQARAFRLADQIETYHEEAIKRRQWMDKAKQSRGYSPNISFDVVWDAVCFEASQAEEMRKALEPFAKIKPSTLYAADGSDGEEYEVILNSYPGNKADFTGKDLARARTALSLMKGGEQHPDDQAVDAFAVAMKAKLKFAREHKGRGGWQGCNPDDLRWMLRDHVQKGDPVDVANFCMFLHALGEGTVPSLMKGGDSK